MTCCHLDQQTAKLSKRLSAALDAGNIPEALELMALLRPIYLDAWKTRRSTARPTEPILVAQTGELPVAAAKSPQLYRAGDKARPTLPDLPLAQVSARTNAR